MKDLYIAKKVSETFQMFLFVKQKKLHVGINLLWVFYDVCSFLKKETY